MSTPVTTTLTQVMTAIANQVRTVLVPVLPGVQVEPELVANPTPPCIDIYPGDPFVTRTSFGPGGGYEAIYSVRARVAVADQEEGQRLLLDMMDPFGPFSVWAALETDASFAGTCDDSTVLDVSGLQPYESVGGSHSGYSGALLGCEWRVQVEL